MEENSTHCLLESGSGPGAKTRARRVWTLVRRPPAPAAKREGRAPPSGLVGVVRVRHHRTSAPPSRRHRIRHHPRRYPQQDLGVYPCPILLPWPLYTITPLLSARHGERWLPGWKPRPHLQPRAAFVVGLCCAAPSYAGFIVRSRLVRPQ